MLPAVMPRPAHMAGSIGPTTSNRISEYVVQSKAGTPFLVPSLTKLKLAASFTTGETGTATYNITNGGNGTASGQLGVTLWASPDGTLDSATQITGISSPTAQINLTRGRRMTVTENFSVGDLTRGSYAIIAQFTINSGFTADQLNPTQVNSPKKYQFIPNAFGNIGGSNISARITDENGNPATVSINGKGSGTFDQSTGVDETEVLLGGNKACILLLRSLPRIRGVDQLSTL